MQFGVFSCCTPEYNPEETLKLLKELGYDYVEWRVTNIPKETPKDVPHAGRYWADNKSTIDIETVEEQAPALAAMSEKYGIKAEALASYLDPSNLEKVETVLRAAKIMGASKIRVFQQRYVSTDDQKNYKLAMAQTKADLQALELLSRKYGVKIILEMHHDTLLSSPSAAWNALAGLDPDCLGINIDPGNMVYEGFENYQKALELLGPFIAHVHVKNAVLKEDGRDELGSMKWKRCWAPLWDGMADLKECFRVLKKYGYDGTVSVEDFTDEQPTREKLAADLAYIKKLVENA